MTRVTAPPQCERRECRINGEERPQWGELQVLSGREELEVGERAACDECIGRVIGE